MLTCISFIAISFRHCDLNRAKIDESRIIFHFGGQHNLPLVNGINAQVLKRLVGLSNEANVSEISDLAIIFEQDGKSTVCGGERMKGEALTTSQSDRALLLVLRRRLELPALHGGFHHHCARECAALGSAQGIEARAAKTTEESMSRPVRLSR